MDAFWDHMPPSDDRILEFSELLQNCRSRVFGFIYAIVLNLADTEDVFQQTASLLWEKFDEYTPGTDFASWALRVARFKASNFVRSRHREHKRFSKTFLDGLYHASLESPDFSHQDRLDALRTCLDKLPEADRSLIFKCYGGEMRIKDVADTEGKSANAVYAMLHRIRKALLACVTRTLGHYESRASN